ncbi:CDP-alcohol phosphatidyltransferase family protein [Alteraurantiacibacter aestuarii]|uniref:CDP-alcohol phosphatidyltransferase family protein n=1 Tax=Alteraurantiacibacter aestuarii TaxID=650004 RepID=A0A844ZNA4_9SPHN|nr:CDP-alcohol phosphatidyltransferase family protein [Alteraurantiacibacter aestuarii]MXO88327.1 CDP-alcohol phosphatidyltransferase family protein [Alteraurantiacibacter aestuarii]
MADRENRRPLKTRQAGWAQALARALGSAGLSPNAISTIGIIFAAAGAWAFLQAGESRWLWLGGALGIQLRLLANMLDGLVAVEGGRKSATGPLFNELPDRVEDALLLIGAGYASGVAELGYGATILAFGTAYIRASGGALGLAQDFVGPMAKQHRMFVLTLGALIACALDDGVVMQLTLWLIIAGSAVTCVIRTQRIAHLLKAQFR